MTPVKSVRFTSLDVFRGCTICFMIIVNTPGSWNYAYAPLLHARWFGFTPTDLVFPSFLFALGNAQSFVTAKWAGLRRSEVLGKIFKRTLLIFLFGYLLSAFPFFHFEENRWHLFSVKDSRIMGVLQRIALTYCISSLMILFLKDKTIWLIGGLILICYWPVLFFCGHFPEPLSLNNNAVLRLDTYIMGSAHLWRGEGVPFDPEGILSTFPAIVNVLTGYYVGRFLQRKGKNADTLLKIMLAGFLLLSLGFLWNYGFPVSKKLWTSSFVLVTTGLDCLILASVTYLTDIAGFTRFNYFFEVFGRNPLPVYILSELLIVVLSMIPVAQHTDLWDWLYNHFFIKATPYLGSLLQAVCYMMICWAVGYFLDKRKIYIRV